MYRNTKLINTNNIMSNTKSGTYASMICRVLFKIHYIYIIFVYSLKSDD